MPVEVVQEMNWGRRASKRISMLYGGLKVIYVKWPWLTEESFLCSIQLPGGQSGRSAWLYQLLGVVRVGSSGRPVTKGSEGLISMRSKCLTVGSYVERRE